jgi:hypothetical protein
MENLTTIPLRKQTRDKLALLGNKHETYDDILVRILNKMSGEKCRVKN